MMSPIVVPKCCPNSSNSFNELKRYQPELIRGRSSLFQNGCSSQSSKPIERIRTPTSFPCSPYEPIVELVNRGDHVDAARAVRTGVYR